MRDRVTSVLGGMTRAILSGAVLSLLSPVAATAANITSLTVNPTTIASGSPLEVTIAFDAPVPPGGIFVPLTSDHIPIVDVPSFWVGEGAFTWGTVFSTGAAPTSTVVTIQATYGGVSKTATVTVIPREPVRGVAGDLWADIILGKPDFGEIVPNQVTGHTLFIPAGAAVDRTVTPNRVYVFDAGNSRILGLSHLGTCASGSKAGLPCTSNSDCPASTCTIQEGRNADLVLGQPSFSRSACNGEGAFQRFPSRSPASASTLCGLKESAISIHEATPLGSMFVDGSGNLYVPDSENNRVLRYNSPFTTDTIADDVWGQADFTGNQCRRGQPAPDAQSFCFAAGVALDSGGNLWVADYFDHRVLRFPYDPGTGSARHQADLVLGQPDFSSFAEGTDMNQMRYPAAVRVDSSGAVYVADEINDRVLIFDPPLTSGMSASRQLNYAFSDPTGLEIDPQGGIWVNDSGHQEPDKNQLLLFVGGVVQKVLYKDVPGSNGVGVVGDRPDFVDDPGGGVNSSWNLLWSRSSIGIDRDGNVLASGAYDDLWRFPAPIPTPTPGIAHSTDARMFKPRQFWIGNELSLSTAYAPSGVAVTGNQLIVADGDRLLFWNNPPSLANGQTASGSVGAAYPTILSQPFFGRIREDQASHLWATRGNSIVAYDVPLTTGATPRVTINSPLPVLGGGSLTWTLLTIGGVAPNGAGTRVWVSDPVEHRVFRIRDPLTSPVVDVVLGQTSASGASCNQGRGELPDAPSRDSLCYPGAVAFDRQGNLYVADHAAEASGNFRLLEYDAGLFPDAPATTLFAIPASRVFGTGGSFTLRPPTGQEFPTALFEPAFNSSGQMVVGGNPYIDPRFPYVYTNPLVSQQPGTLLNDLYSWPQAATFDSGDNLYVVDGNRGRVLVYLNPLPNSPPPVFTLTVTKAGAGTGVVKSTPFGIDCGADCSQAFVSGRVVALTAIPDPNFIFGGWTGDADCADGAVTMSADKTCTATFQSPASGDLIVSVLTAPATGGAGLAISVTDTTKNQGAGLVAASTTKFYLSTNTTWDAGDVYLGSRAIPSLGAGAVSTASTSLTVPAGTAPGTYYVIAKADADGLISETNEANNSKASAAIKIGPDLIVSPVTVPATAGAGLAVSVTDTTKNQTGTSSAPASTTKFYLSTNTTWDVGDVYLGSRAVPSLAAGAASTGSTSVTIPAGTATGTFYVIAKADADGLIFETNETNNNATSAAIKIGPDLIVSALTAPATGGAGLAMTVTETTNNPGGGSAAASTTKFYLSTNTTWDVGDVYLGSRAIPALGAGVVSTASTSLTIPAGTATGSYYVIGKADADGLVVETAETNNTRASAAVKIGPDLILSALTAPATGGEGLTISVTDTTKNQGGGPAAASTTKFYLSTNTTWDVGDVYLGSRAIPALGIGVVSTASTSLTIPAGTATGSYYVIGKADADGLVVETTETNNTLSRAIKIGPDLIVSALTVPATAAAGAAITVTDTTKDQTGMSAAPASTTKFYLSTNTTWDVADITLGSRSIPSLAAGAVNTASTSLTIPAGTTTGTYYVIAKADADLLIWETSETNNTLYGTIKIGPDLIVSPFTVPATGGAGLAISVTDTTKNQGGGAASASTTKFFLSGDNVWDAGDVYLGSRSTPALAAGATSVASTSLTIPAGTATGSYYVIARADADGVVLETLETNNTAAGAIKIGPDLIVSVLTVPSIAAAGAVITVTDTTKNQGGAAAAASTTTFYLSLNTTWEAGDTSLGSRAIPILAPLATSAGSTSVTIPAGTIPGAYYILARADANAAIAETSETNNVTSKPISITP